MIKPISLPIKYLLIGAAASLGLLSAVLAHQSVVTLRTDNADHVSTESRDSEPEADITVNGTPIPLDEGTTTLKTGEDQTATVNVHHSGQVRHQESQTTQSVNSDGTLNVTVTSSSNNSSGRTRVHFRGGGSDSVNSSSRIKVETRGEGQVHVED